MKRSFLFVAITALCIACGNNTEEKKEEKPATTEVKPEEKQPASNSNSSNPVYTKGLALIAASDCLTCHKVEEKLIGPAYRDIANKYDNNEKNTTDLINKIIKGGQGVWGQVPMAAHPTLSEADARAMVQYIFLLKNK